MKYAFLNTKHDTLHSCIQYSFGGREKRNNLRKYVPCYYCKIINIMNIFRLSPTKAITNVATEKKSIYIGKVVYLLKLYGLSLIHI